MRLYFLAFFLCFFVSACSQSKFQQLKGGSSSDQFSRAGVDFLTEDFVLGEKKALVDFLLVLDATESMFHHYEGYGQAFLDLLSVISDYDWQLAFTSADHGDHEDPSGLQASWRDHVLDPYGRFGSLMPLEDGRGILRTEVLNPKVRNHEDVFFHTISHGDGIDYRRPPYRSGPLEQPLRSSMSAMQRAELDNSPLFRPLADLVLLFWTNDGEREEDKARATSAQQVVQTFYKTFGHLDKNFLAFSILIMDEDCLDEERKRARENHIAEHGRSSLKEGNGQLVRIGTSIMELAKLTGGENYSICDENYGQVFRDISRYIKDSLESSIVLKREPIPGTVEIHPKLDYKRYGRKIVFEKVSGPTPVSVSYQSRK